MVGLFALNSVRFRVPMQIGGLIGGCVPLNSGMFFATLLEDLCPKLLRGIVPPTLTHTYAHWPQPVSPKEDSLDDVCHCAPSPLET